MIKDYLSSNGFNILFRIDNIKVIFMNVLSISYINEWKLNLDIFLTHFRCEIVLCMTVINSL